MRNKYLGFFSLILWSILISPFIVSSQNKYVVNITQPQSVQAPTIISISTNTENKNQIIWEEPANDNILYFNIYRDAIDQKGWIYAGQVIYPGNFSFDDLNSFPNIRSYQYRVSAVDECKNEFFNHTVAKTIKLSIEENSDSTFLLKWNSYEGFNVQTYKIYRGVEPGNVALIDSTTASATSYTDHGNPSKNEYYQIEAVGKPDDILIEEEVGLSNFKSRSNVAFAKPVLSSSDSLDAFNLQLYPNPFTTNAVIVFPYDPTQKYQLTILDIMGHTVYTQPVFSGEIEIERGNLKEGLYLLQIAGKKILRKKLMVGSYKA